MTAHSDTSARPSPSNEPAAPDHPGYNGDIKHWFIRLLTLPRLRTFFLKLPLTRPIASRQAQDVFDLCAGFVYAKILETFVELGLHEELFRRPLSARAAAAASGLSSDAAERLLRGACALGLVRLGRDGLFRLGMKGAALIDNPGAIAMIRHHQAFYRDLDKTMEILRGERTETEISQYWSYLAEDRQTSMQQETTNDYSDLMAQSQIMVAEMVVDAFDFSRYPRILDVGGGTGTFMSHVAVDAPKSDLAVFDLPQVAITATQSLRNRGLGDRITAIGGDFVTGTLPEGYDLVTLVRVLFDHGDGTVRALLKSIHQALPDGGKLLIAEPIAADDATDKTADAYFNFYLLAMGPGRVRTRARHEELLHEAGFGKVEAFSTINPGLCRLLLASK